MFTLFSALILFFYFLLWKLLFPMPLLLVIPIIIFLFPTLAVIIRRMHDINHNGWWGGVIYFFPMLYFDRGYLLLVLPLRYKDYFVLGWSILLLESLYLIYFLSLLLTASCIGPNRYGEDPIGNPDREPGRGTGMTCMIISATILTIVLALVFFVLHAISQIRW